jgi:hypothetical protein
MLSKSSFTRGISPRGPVEISKLEEFSKRVGGMKIQVPKKMKIKGLAVAGVVIGMKHVFKGGSNNSVGSPFKTVYRIVITGRFSPEDVGDPATCGVIDSRTAYVVPMWHEYFKHDKKEEDEYRKTHPNLDGKRKFKDPVGIGKVIIKPLSVIDVSFELKSPAPGAPVQKLVTSNGDVGIGSWIKFTNLHYEIKRNNNTAEFKAGAATSYCRSEFENYFNVGDFGMAMVPFPVIPEPLEATTPEQIETLALMERQLQIADKAMTEFFKNSIDGLLVEQKLPQDELENLKSLLVFSFVDEEHKKFLNNLGVDFNPWKIEAECIQTETKGHWTTMNATVNGISFGQNGETRKLSYFLNFVNCNDIVLKRMGIGSAPGVKIVSRLIAAAERNIRVYGTINLNSTLRSTLLVDTEGNPITDDTIVVDVVDIEMDMIGAIMKAGIPVTLEHVNFLLRSDDWGTATLRSPNTPRTYNYDEKQGFINLTESLMPADGNEFVYYVVAFGISQMSVNRFYKVCSGQFKGDTEKASLSVMKYLLSLPGAEPAIWEEEVNTLAFKNKAWEAPMIFGISKKHLETYRARPELTAVDRQQKLSEWMAKAVEFYKFDTEGQGEEEGEEPQLPQPTVQDEERDEISASSAIPKKRVSHSKSSKSKKVKRDLDSE